MSDALVPYQDLESMAEIVVRSGMFAGIKTPQQAMALFLIAQANGLHPMKAALMYDILPNGKPSMKGEAMLAEFQARGGQVYWKQRDSKECRAVFMSPGCPEGFEASFTIEEAQAAALAGKDNWKKYPADMLQWRCVTRGVKATLPAAGLGLYPTEVARDFEDPDPKRVVAEAEIVPPEAPQDLTGALEASIEAVKARKVGGKAKDAEPVGGESEPAEPPAVYRNKLFIKEPGPMQLPTPMPLGEFPAPERCAYCLEEGHDTPIGLYFSEQPGHEGEAYEQCSWAHAERERLEKKGKSRQEAQAAVARHFRAWAKKGAK